MRAYALLCLAVLATTAAPLQQAAADELFSLVVDPFTGAAALRNDGPTSVSIDSYLFTAAGNPVLDPQGWSSFESGALAGWKEIGAGADRLGELNLTESLTITSGESRSIGSPYTPFSPTEIGQPEPGLSVLDFHYTLANETFSRAGDVEFSARNTVVLVVDPATGAASLVNQSAFDIDLDSYLIKSVANVLEPGTWSPLASTDASWTSSTGAPSRLFEGNLQGSTFLAADGGSLELGNPINPSALDDETDLELEFTFAGSQSVSGGVLFSPSFVAPALDGDFNGDGVVDIADFTVWRDNLGAEIESALSGNGDGTNGVDQGDYDLWKANFGNSVADLATGAELHLSAASTAVPEPATGAGLVATVAAVMLGQHVRRNALL